MSINKLTKKLIPFAIVVFISYFFSSLLLFLMPTRSIEFNKNSNSYIENNFMNNEIVDSSTDFFTSAIYYSDINMDSWAILKNRSQKTFFIKEGDVVDGYTIVKIEKNLIKIKKENKEYAISLNINQKSLNDIIKGK